MRIALPLLLVALVGCFHPSWQLQWARVDLTEKKTEFTEERTALLRQYRKCLKRSESDASVDCSAYRTAVEVIDARDY